MDRLIIVSVLVLSISVFPSIYAGTFDTCSFLHEVKCAEHSNCTDLIGGGIECSCLEGYYGDGYRETKGCLPISDLYPCENDNQCHVLGRCNYDIGAKCVCNEGYTGNGKDQCSDVNECAISPCDPDATCLNSPGSFSCQCNQNHKGDGFNCSFYCITNSDCHAEAVCESDTQCHCKDGFVGNGRYNCTDVNECLDPNTTCHNEAECINTVGSYTCVCKPGYKGDGKSCEKIPINCHEHYLLNRKVNSYYEIDPDGPGPLLPFSVECHMRTDIEMGITIIRPLEPKVQYINQNGYTLNDTVEYSTTIDNTKAVVDNSGHCYQDMTARCVWYRPKHLNGDDFWYDRNGQPHQTWGGANVPGMCICGELGVCKDPTASCNCDGTQNAVDSGRLSNRTFLPITGFAFGLAGWQRMDVTAGPVVCGPKSFDVPLDCHDALKNHNRKLSGPMQIDPDGPDGVLEPLYVYCDMNTYPHVGVTVIPHNRKLPETAVDPETFDFTYQVPTEFIDGVVQNSAFCRQEVSYTCTDSRITNNGTFWTDINGQQMSYFPGALIPEGCACGTVNRCANGEKCNCDNYDGIERKDFGAITDKNHLPLGTLTLNDLGSAGQKGKFSVGALQCSQMEFGFEATCESYRIKGHTDSYVYMIDPDGPEILGKPDPTNTPPFPAECNMVLEPPHGMTIIHNENEDYYLIANDELVYDYVQVSDEQLDSLRTRSVFCYQSFHYNCSNAPLYDINGNPIVYWKSIDNEEKYYYAGTGGDALSCTCGLSQSCEGGSSSKCNCDINDSALRQDVGDLQNKDDLPVRRIVFPNDSARNGSVKLGPLICSDTHPTCYDRLVYMNRHRLPNEHRYEDGEVTIDPDGPGGVDPFTVTCYWQKTIVPVEPDDNNQTNTDPNQDPITECFDVGYKNNVSREQIQVLKDRSKYCGQKLKFECLNAPIIDKVTFETCDGVTQPGWAGSNGEPKCACGVTGSCEGGKLANCNCDLEDGQTHVDDGYIFNKNRLAVCGVCITLDTPKDVNSPRVGTYTVGNLECSGSWPLGVGLYPNCQQRRNHKNTNSETVILDPDGGGPVPPFPVRCVYEVHPPTGTAEIIPIDDDYDVPKNGSVPEIKYFIFEMQYSYVRKLVLRSTYCEQEVYVLCGNASKPPIEEGRKLDHWTWTTRNAIRCKPENQLCYCYGNEVFGGIVTFKFRLPVASVKLPKMSHAHPRRLYIGATKCYHVYKHCDDIRRYRMWGNPNRDNIYAIDPDQGGGEPHFPALCDFKTNKTYGITIVKLKPDKEKIDVTIYNTPYPENKTVPIEYKDANPVQVNRIADVSGFCYQGIQYKCFKAPIYNETTGNALGTVNLYDGTASTSFGANDYTNNSECMCSVLDTCVEGNRCHCDAAGAMFRYDYGVVSMNNLPVTQVSFSNIDEQNSYGVVSVTDVRCAPKPFNLPIDCDDARKKGFKTGEVMIWPRENVEPFFVHCNIDDLVPGHGVAIISNNVEDPQPVDPTTDTEIKVNYTGIKDEQVEVIVSHHKFCYQPIKYDCLNSLLLGANKFEWINPDNVPFRYLGSGTNAAQTCSCGNDGYCGGNDTRAVLETRQCNCDVGDGEWRRDAGIISNTDDLPIMKIRIAQSSLDGSNSSLTLGKLYCANKKFDLNECQLDFHDCHSLAYCKNTDGSFQCLCKAGYRGADVPNVWANGRNCYDDDECKRPVCPLSADCVNLPGKFECVCKDGYDQIGPRVCRNIDECANDTLNDCHQDAVCFDLEGLEGKYKCRCKPGFDGNGTHCTPVGTCSCFGDPHCKSFDKKWMHFQGDCQYLMSSDGCNGNTRSYEIRTTFWDQDKPFINDVSWVKEVEVRLYDEHTHVIELLQNYEVKVDGFLTKLPFMQSDAHFYVRKFDRDVKLTLIQLGISVIWDGKQSVEVIVGHDFINKTCGLCGNFDGDANNDWVIGDECPNTGSQTDNVNLFGTSWAIGEYVQQNECRFDCNAPPPEECSEMAQSIARSYCDDYIYVGEMYGKKFRKCLANMTSNEMGEFYVSCTTDVCKNMKDKMGAICDHAEELVKTCADDYLIEITNWKTSDMCGEQCGEYEEYGMSSEASQTDCAEVVQGTPLEGKSPIPVEGCYCKEGYVMDAGKCVLPEECGCIYEGAYYSVDDIIVLTGCHEKYTCGPNNTLDVAILDCHENATCGLEDGVYGCHCNEGFVSMDNSGTDCLEDPCTTNPCNGTGQKCVLNTTNEEGYNCECLMGYTGDCNKCEDIDECATHTDDCTSNAKCKNLNGTYECECYDGFTEKTIKGKDECVDIDECGTGLHDCNTTTHKCVNTLGGFQCIECEEGTSGDSCCVCVGNQCQKTNPVCGSDGQTYQSLRDLIISDCKLRYESMQEGEEKRISMDYEGECQATCANTQCKKYQECKENTETTGTPSCECEPCTESETEENEVCSVMLDSYRSVCDFKKAMCSMDEEDELLPDNSPCEDEKNGPPVEEWGEWSECSVSCGNGTKTRSRNATANIDTEYLKQKYPIEATTSCYMDPCPDSPCYTMTCDVDGQVCVVNEDGSASCECPNCAGQGLEESCGKVGEDRDTYKNPCEIQAEACQKGLPFDLLHEGRCGVEPLECTKMDNFVRKVHNGCVKMVNMGKCDGGCGLYSNHCCRPKTMTSKMETFRCEGNTYYQEYDVIEECECEAIPLP